MTRILTHYYPDMEANDNALVMTPMFEGMKFMGYAIIKGNWKRAEQMEMWDV